MAVGFLFTWWLDWKGGSGGDLKEKIQPTTLGNTANKESFRKTAHSRVCTRDPSHYLPVASRYDRSNAGP